MNDLIIISIIIVVITMVFGFFLVFFLKLFVVAKCLIHSFFDSCKSEFKFFLCDDHREMLLLYI